MNSRVLAPASLVLGLVSSACSIDWSSSKEPTQQDAASVGATKDGGVSTNGPGELRDAGGRDAGFPVDSSTDDAGRDAGTLSCGPGLQNVDDSCVDRDECALLVDDCDASPRACVNTAPTSGPPYLCSCPAGFTGDGRGADGCQDINECAAKPCGAGAVCSNVFGSFSCGQCPPGQTGGGIEPCVDLDECAENNGGCGPVAFYTCQNNVGSAPTCTDIDECSVNNGGCGSAAFFRCNNNVGAAPTCTDIDECSATDAYCDTSPTAACVNRQGEAATCTCPTLYLGDGIGSDGCSPVSCANYDGCSVDYPCVDRAPGVSCRGQFPDWSLGSVPNRFTTNALTTTDAKTGLVWQRFVPQDVSNCGTDAACALLGASCGDDAACTAQEARAYCNNLVLDGQLDWRLPTRSELISILDFTRFDPAMDPLVFPGVMDGWFWTTSNIGGSLFYRIDAAYGDTGLEDPSLGQRVRCVR